MTDSSTSGPPRPSGGATGAPSNGGPAGASGVAPASDASSTLAALERKLHELERDLSAIGFAARRAADSAVPAAHAPPDPHAPPDSHAPPGAEGPGAFEVAVAETGTEPTTSSSVPRATIRLVDEASPAAGDLSPPAPPILSRDADPALFPGAGRSTGAPAPVPGGAWESGGAWASAPSGPGPGPGPDTVVGAREPRFECRVELDVGPFADIETLSSFERSLARLPHTLAARVRRFDGARAAIDLRLVLTPMLVQEMHEALGVGFSVVDSGPGHLTIVLDRR